MDHQLIKVTQHGFIPGKSCFTNLLTFLARVTSYIDSGFPVDVIYLDFSKVFDKMLHERLLMEVKTHGIEDNIHRWIGEWLKNRKERVVMSEWSLVKSRVPQGSVLEPLLFTMHINGSHDNIVSHILKLTDDTQFFFSKVATQG